MLTGVEHISCLLFYLAHFFFQLDTPVDPITVLLQYVLDMLLHVEFIRCRRVVSLLSPASVLVLLLTFWTELRFWGGTSVSRSSSLTL